MNAEFKLLINEIKEQDRKINELSRKLGSKEARIKLLEDLCETDDKIINQKKENIKSLEGLLSKYGKVTKGRFQPYSHMTNVNDYKDTIVKQGHFTSKGITYTITTGGE